MKRKSAKEEAADPGGFADASVYAALRQRARHRKGEHAGAYRHGCACLPGSPLRAEGVRGFLLSKQGQTACGVRMPLRIGAKRSQPVIRPAADAGVVTV